MDHLPLGGMKVVDYIDQFDKGRLVDTLASIDPDHQLLLMEDNACSHVAKITKAFCDGNNINTIEWPPQSPDLNPIGNLWKIFKNRIQEHYQPKSIPKMKQAIQKAWDDIPIEHLHNLVNFMPNQMRLIVKADGGPIKY
jgi:hypothetical protein